MPKFKYHLIYLHSRQAYVDPGEVYQDFAERLGEYSMLIYKERPFTAKQLKELAFDVRGSIKGDTSGAEYFKWVTIKYSVFTNDLPAHAKPYADYIKEVKQLKKSIKP